MMAWVACCGVRTMKLTAFDIPPPGLVTVTLKLPAVAMSKARRAAVSCVALTKVVERPLPLKLTAAPLTKYVPFTVKVNAAPPAIALVGEMLVIVGVWTVQDFGGNAVSDRRRPDCPVENGDPPTSVSVPVLATLNTEIKLLPLATYNRLPSLLVAKPDGRKAPGFGNGEPATSVRLPLLATLNTVILFWN